LPARDTRGEPSTRGLFCRPKSGQGALGGPFCGLLPDNALTGEHMSQIQQEIGMEDSALPEGTQKQLRAMRSADIVIGIPSHRNARTIGEVVDAVVEGIGTYLGDQHILLINADGGSSDNTPRYVAEADVTPSVTALVTDYVGGMGKGNGIRAILEAAAILRPKACLVLEARCPGITPEWLPALLNPVLGGADLALACYQRSAYAAALTDNLVYPFVRTLFNADLREPLAGEFCTSGQLAAEIIQRDVWETDVARFGINVWLAVESLAENRRIVQVDVGYRGEGHCDPGDLSDTRFLHAVGTLFRYLTIYRSLWQQDLPERTIPFHGARQDGGIIRGTECIGLMLRALSEGSVASGDLWRQILRPETLKGVHALLDQKEDAFTFPIGLWADVVAEFAIVYNRGDGDPDKVVEALLPIFYARAAAYIRESEGMTVAERESIVRRVLQEFLARRPMLRQLWDDYRPWLDPIGYWPNL